MSDQDLLLDLFNVLARSWAAVCEHHPEVPKVDLVPLPAPRLRHEWKPPFRWRARPTANGVLHELEVVVARMNFDSDEVLEQLLHEAAHALAFVGGLCRQSMSTGAHGRGFAQAAVVIGLGSERSEGGR